MRKTILITGSTDGIGKLAALSLAKEGHDIYLHGRSTEKLKSTITEIKGQSNNESVNGFIADLSDLGAVKTLANQITSELPKINVLINNAGVYKSHTPNNKNGLDMRLVVNYLASYLLTNRLLPLLHKGTDPRIINLSSAAQASVDLNVLSGKAQASERETYAQSKLALTMWSFYLAKKQKDVTVIAVNPGSLLNTKMVAEAFGNSWSPADKGATILHQLATAEKYKGVTGQYFDNDQGSFGKAHADAYEKVKIEKLLKATIGIVSERLG